MNRQQLHGLAALLLIVGGGLFIFTETVAAAVGGLLCTFAAAGLMLFAWYRNRSS